VILSETFIGKAQNVKVQHISCLQNASASPSPSQVAVRRAAPTSQPVHHTPGVIRRAAPTSQPVHHTPGVIRRAVTYRPTHPPGLVRRTPAADAYPPMQTPDDVCGANCTSAPDCRWVLVGLTSLGATHCLQSSGGGPNPYDCKVIADGLSSQPHSMSKFLSLFIIIDSEPLYILDSFTLNPGVSIVCHEEH
jgi:hypothetical protein